MREREDWIPREWLGGKASVEQIEAVQLQGCSDRYRVEWRSFISQMQPGDQLRCFSSPEKLWRLMAGRAGYAIVRQDEVVDSFVVILS